MCYYKVVSTPNQTINFELKKVDKITDFIGDKKFDEALNLIKSLQNVNQVDSYGNPIICVAAAFGGLEIIKYLIEEKNVDVNSKSSINMTPLMDASLHSNLDIVEYLISKHADINAANDDFDTALSLALENSSDKVIICLLNNGADKNYIHPNEGSMLEIAKRHLRNDVIYLFEN